MAEKLFAAETSIPLVNMDSGEDAFDCVDQDEEALITHGGQQPDQNEEALITHGGQQPRHCFYASLHFLYHIFSVLWIFPVIALFVLNAINYVVGASFG
jgi:hypothetical protein